jgi:hypothetical protein
MCVLCSSEMLVVRYDCNYDLMGQFFVCCTAGVAERVVNFTREKCEGEDCYSTPRIKGSGDLRGF